MITPPHTYIRVIIRVLVLSTLELTHAHFSSCKPSYSLSLSLNTFITTQHLLLVLFEEEWLAIAEVDKGKSITHPYSSSSNSTVPFSLPITCPIHPEHTQFWFFWRHCSLSLSNLLSNWSSLHLLITFYMYTYYSFIFQQLLSFFRF